MLMHEAMYIATYIYMYIMHGYIVQTNVSDTKG